MDNRGHRLGLARLLLVERGLLFLKLLPLRDVPGYHHQQLLPVLARPQYPSLRLQVNVVSRPMPEPIFDSASASGQHRITQCLLHFRQIIGMDFNQRVTPSEALDGISKHPCVGCVIPDPSSLRVDDRDQIIDVIDDQFQQSQVSDQGFVFLRFPLGRRGVSHSF